MNYMWWWLIWTNICGGDVRWTIRRYFAIAEGNEDGETSRAEWRHLTAFKPSCFEFNRLGLPDTVTFGEWLTSAHQNLKGVLLQPWKCLRYAAEFISEIALY